MHRVCCVNAAHLVETERERMVTVRWIPSETSAFLVAIQVEAMDSEALLSDVTRALSDQHMNILSASVTTTRNRVIVSKFTFEVHDLKHLAVAMHAVREVDGVYDAYRINEKPGPNP